jgi:hypothetical protein
VQKNFDNGLFASVAYNYLISKDVNSIEAEITGDAFAFNPALEMSMMLNYQILNMVIHTVLLV